MGKYRPAHEHSDSHHQQGNGTQFLQDHTNLLTVVRHGNHQRSQRANYQASIRIPKCGQYIKITHLRLLLVWYKNTNLKAILYKWHFVI